MQSGSLGASLLRRARDLEMGLSWFVSLGDKSDVSANDLLQFWADDQFTARDRPVHRELRQPTQVRPHRPPSGPHQTDRCGPHRCGGRRPTRQRPVPTGRPDRGPDGARAPRHVPGARVAARPPRSTRRDHHELGEPRDTGSRGDDRRRTHRVRHRAGPRLACRTRRLPVRSRRRARRRRHRRNPRDPRPARARLRSRDGSDDRGRRSRLREARGRRDDRLRRRMGRRPGQRAQLRVPRAGRRHPGLVTCLRPLARDRGGRADGQAARGRSRTCRHARQVVARAVSLRTRHRCVSRHRGGDGVARRLQRHRCGSPRSHPGDRCVRGRADRVSGRRQVHQASGGAVGARRRRTRPGLDGRSRRRGRHHGRLARRRRGRSSWSRR